MKYVSVCGRELTMEEMKSMEQFRSYTDGVSFACLEEGVMMMLPEEESKDPEKLKEAALEAMEYCLQVQPDFYVWKMPGHLMIGMDEGLFVIDRFFPDMDPDMVALLLRNHGLLACENGNVIAVAYEED